MSAAQTPARSTETNATRVMRDDALTPKHRLLVEYMLHGVHHHTLCDRVIVERPIMTPDGPATICRKPEVGEPLYLLEAATVLRIRRRAARNLSAQPAFQRLLAKETAAFRDGARARATRRMVNLIEEPGQNKAADRKVQLAASMAVLGEGDARGTTVNVQVNNTLTPGIVIRLPDSAPRTKLDHQEFTP